MGFGCLLGVSEEGHILVLVRLTPAPSMKMVWSMKRLSVITSVVVRELNTRLAGNYQSMQYASSMNSAMMA